MPDSMTVAKCLEFAVMTEEMGAELYQQLALKFAGDPELRELFQGLVRDEVHHGKQFRELQVLASEKYRERPVPAEQEEYLRAVAQTPIFSADKGLLGDVSTVRTREDALERSLHLERATLAYYQGVRDVTGPDPLLDALIAVEKRHVVTVTKLMVTGAKFRGLSDHWA